MTEYNGWLTYYSQKAREQQREEQRQSGNLLAANPADFATMVGAE